ncbi:pentatricopeptide repeat-containing protein At1g05600 [Impatiens glandulifera]|uniref:pentatricopeptide repeat-containing protein At1g05600 n=1 Tax=Impatiens glandulifera TaxID=253017 RepID=UPI001FB083A5|nr:pentatricopeptide repeat-containing protein At1g05600 [Impatiens glandulifera]XP_047312037.1 pentatricopeptide repeat-containing protein At1g05600 [Impatiens glandulifera]
MSLIWPRLLTPSKLIQLIKIQKNPIQALEIFNQAKSRFPNYHHNGPVYASMIEILGNSGRITEMKQVISQMKDDSCECKDSVFANVIKLYAKSGLLNEAVSLFRTIPQFNCVKWTHSFNTLLQILVKESQIKTSYHLFLKNSGDWSVKSQLTSLNLLIEVLCQNNRSDLALQIFQEMSHQCCYPNNDTYLILMRGLCRDGRLSDATHLLYSMFWRISIKGSGEDVVVYRTLLDALCDYGEVQRAVDILNKILKKGLKSRTRYRNHLDIHDCDNIVGAKMLIHETLVKGLIPSSGSYTALATGLYSEGMIAEADKVIHEMKINGFQPTISIYEARLASLCREGRIDEAEQLIENDLAGDCHVPTVGLYKVLIESMCKQRKSALAVKLLEKMRLKGGADMETYTIVVDGLCKDGNFVDASKILQKMLGKSCWHKTSTHVPYDILIQGLCSIGRQFEAILWMQEMVSQGKTPDSSVWKHLLTSICSNMADIDLAYEIVEQLRRS